MKSLLVFLITVLTLVARPAAAGFQIGTGFNSETGGRLIPSLNIGVNTGAFEVLFSSTGVSTTAYSHSSYSLGAYWTRKSGDFLFGSIVAGFGVGSLYAVRTFQDTGAEEEKKDDFALGPAFFGRWFLAGSAFLSVEAVYGLGDPSLHLGDILGMNARDHVNFSIGVEL